MKSSTVVLLGIFCVMVQWMSGDLALRFGDGAISYRIGLALIFAVTIFGLLQCRND